MAIVTETEPEATPATEAGPVTFAPYLLTADRYVAVRDVLPRPLGEVR